MKFSPQCTNLQGTLGVSDSTLSDEHSHIPHCPVSSNDILFINAFFLYHVHNHLSTTEACSYMKNKEGPTNYQYNTAQCISQCVAHNYKDWN